MNFLLKKDLVYIRTLTDPCILSQHDESPALTKGDKHGKSIYTISLVELQFFYGNLKKKQKTVILHNQQLLLC